jgi:hypothetical protein
VTLIRSLWILLPIAFLTSVPGFAQFTPIAQPTAAYTSGTTLFPITVTDGTSVSSLAAGGQTITFSQTMTAGTVPATWLTWGSPPNTEGSTPRVLVTSGTSLTLTLDTPAQILGFEIEPNNVTPVTITAAFRNGAVILGTVTLSFSGYSSALLAAASDPSQPITAVDISAPASNGFAIARLRDFPTTVTTPTLSFPALAGLALALAGLGVMLARRARPAASF